MNIWILAVFLAQAAVVQVPTDQESIRAGAAVYSMRCASCHGTRAEGANNGSDLTALWTAGGKDQPLFQSIRRGLPNTLKPHSFGPDKDIWAVLAYLRTLDAAPSAGRAAAGNAENGERLFRENCSRCHQVNGRGGRLGPDLSHVASTRYQPVTLVTRAGQRVRGVKKNEDAFSIQIMDTQERLQGYLKVNLRELVNDETSVMPDFGADRLSDRDIDDLLAYLATL